ncbi:MAG: subclass B1 metallo-beta-lactamase [Cytophagales bacterium]|nr:subclass B1 metallo-beta-lactamase [Cytophagales bacterium]
MKKFVLVLLLGYMPFIQAQQITLKQLSENTFIHTSYLQTDDFGHVPCNGLVIRNGQQALVFDTPTDDKGAKELIRLVQDSLHCKIVMVIPTHFHNDCLGGLQAFHDAGIPSIANELTLELAKNSQVTIPEFSFHKSFTFKVGQEKVLIKFLGQGHTRDNVVGYFPKEKVLFGGCLIKELGASKGFLGDANVNEWPATVAKVKKAFPRVKWVVPGHGDAGDASLLDYTRKLFLSLN